MSFDLTAVGNAIAVRFGPTIVSAPTNETNIRQSTASLPATIADEPVVFVFPPTLTFSYGPSLRNAAAAYPVRFYLYKSTRDTPYNSDLINKWMTALYATMDGQAQLGLSSYVNMATMGDVTPGQLSYNGVDYHGLSWTVNVGLSEGLSAQA
jgi:hypothetical protein